MSLSVRLLGTGDAGGVPRYGCACGACERATLQPGFWRRPSTALVETDQARILIDAGLTDLTEHFPPGSLSAIVLTHFHPDHVQGLLHLRWGLGEAIPVYCPPDATGCADLFKNPGLLDFRPLTTFESILIGDVSVTPLPLIHSKITFGYALTVADRERFAYLTDTLDLPAKTLDFLQEWKPDAVALDCTHPPSAVAPRNHNDLRMALAIADQLAPATVYLTHVGHALDAWLLDPPESLPTNVRLARDGLRVFNR